jgi:hypothetical protein
MNELWVIVDGGVTQYEDDAQLELERVLGPFADQASAVAYNKKERLYGHVFKLETPSE